MTCATSRVCGLPTSDSMDDLSRDERSAPAMSSMAGSSSRREVLLKVAFFIAASITGVVVTVAVERTTLLSLGSILIAHHPE